MRCDICVHVRLDTVVTAVVKKSGYVVVTLAGENGSGDDVHLFFDDVAHAEKLADAIYYAKMDCDADSIQADSPAVVME